MLSWFRLYIDILETLKAGNFKFIKQPPVAYQI